MSSVPHDLLELAAAGALVGFGDGAAVGLGLGFPQLCASDDLSASTDATENDHAGAGVERCSPWRAWAWTCGSRWAWTT